MPTTTDKTEAKDTSSLSGKVKDLVKKGWHFKDVDGKSFYAHNDDGRFFGCTKVADIVAAIDESEKAANEAVSTEGQVTTDALFSPSDAAVLDTLNDQ